MLIEICDEEHLVLKVVNKRNLCKPIERSEEFDLVSRYLIEEPSIRTPKVFLRYSLPKMAKYNAKRFISMTMFESDTVPPSWIDALNFSDLVIVPTDWGKNIFSSCVTSEVTTIPLPVNSIYYNQMLSFDLLPGKDKFRFITVGNYFQPDRKRLIPLIETFGEYYKDNDDVELYVKSSWTDKGSPNTIAIDKVCSKYKNVILDTNNVDTDELIKLYCSSHAALFPSMGEGYGLPHVEAALLGRPLVVADNSSMTTLSEKIPWIFKTKCKTVPANYTPQLISDAGNWAECDMNEFMKKSDKLYKLWLKDKEAYNIKITQSHRSDKLRSYISHSNIKELFRAVILDQLGKV